MSLFATGLAAAKRKQEKEEEKRRKEQEEVDDEEDGDYDAYAQHADEEAWPTDADEGEEPPAKKIRG